MNWNGGRVQSSGLASTTSRWESRRIGLRVGFTARRRATRFPFFGAFSKTATSLSGKPAALRRTAIAFAAARELPIDSSVLISTSCLKRSWATVSQWVSLRDDCAWETVAVRRSRALGRRRRKLGLGMGMGLGNWAWAWAWAWESGVS